jgi:heptosyltransferase-2
LNRIFVKSVNWVGDAVLVTPTLRILRRAFPHAHLTVMARPWVAPVFEANPDVDRLWVAEENKSLRIFREIAARVRKEKFDLGIALPNSFGAALLMAMGRVKRRIGYNRDGRGLLLTDRVQATNEILKAHQVEYYLHLLRGVCDLDAHPRELVLLEAPGAAQHVLGILEKHGLGEAIRQGVPLAAICPGATYGGAKRWHPDRFAAVADHLTRKWNARVVVVGSHGERPIAEKIRGRAKTPISVLSGEIPLRDLIALCGYLRVFVTNDSGAMHVAAARGVPIVAVFGPTDWVTTAPYHPGAIIVRKDGVCPKAPCLERHCPLEHHVCMDKVGVLDVIEAVDKQMAMTNDEWRMMNGKR